MHPHRAPPRLGLSCERDAEVHFRLARGADAADGVQVRRARRGGDVHALRAAVERDIDAGRTPEASVVQRTQGLLRNIEGRWRTP